VAIYFDQTIATTTGPISSVTLFGIGDSWADGASSETQTFTTLNGAGTYTVHHVAVQDLAGNLRTYTPAQLQALGAPTSILLQGITAPTAFNLNQSHAYTEDQPSVPLTSIIVSDPDAGAAITATLTLANPAAGALTTSGGGSYTAGTGLWTVTGSVAAVNTALAAVAFVPAANFDQDTTIAVAISDTITPTVTGSIVLDVTPVNDAPTLAATSLSPTFTEPAGAGTQAPPVAVFSGANAGTVEAGQSIIGLTFRITNLADGADEKVGVDGTTIALGVSSAGTTANNGMTYAATVAGSTATVVLTKPAGLSATTINSIVNGITYQDTNADNPAPGGLIITLTEIKDSGGGSDTTALSIASIVNVVATNDPPALADAIPNQSSDEDSLWSFVVPANTFGDPDNNLTYGTTRGDGSALPRWLAFAPASRTFSGTPPLDFNGPLSFKVTASDGISSVSGTFTLMVNPVNDAPSGADRTVTILQHHSHVFAPTDFALTDPRDASAPNTLAGVKIATLPSGGVLVNNGVAATPGQIIPLSDIVAGKFAFLPAGNAFGTAADQFTFQVQDNGGTANGGVDLDPTANVFSFDVRVAPPQDFNGDRISDLLLRKADGTLEVGNFNSNNQFSQFTLPGQIGPEWQPVGTGDFNGDGISDLLLRTAGGNFLLGNFNSNNQFSKFTFPGQIGPEWQTVGIGDFNGDGTSDLLLRKADGVLMVGDFNNNQFSQFTFPGQIGLEWQTVGIGDFNGDGTSDLLLRKVDGALMVGDFNNNQFSQFISPGQIGSEWQTVGIGDFNRDGISDLLLRKVDGPFLLGNFNSSNQFSKFTFPGQIGPEWATARIADFNGDGTSDLMLRKSDGTFLLGNFSDNQFSAFVFPGQIGPEWLLL
jgi:hypothetical protein